MIYMNGLKVYLSSEWTVLDEMDFDDAFDVRWMSFPRAMGSIAP